MKKKLIAVVLGLLFFAARNGFSQTSALPPPSAPKQTSPSSPAQKTPSEPKRRPPSEPKQRTPSEPKQRTPSTPVQRPSTFVQREDVWKNKRWYVGGFLGGGYYSYKWGSNRYGDWAMTGLFTFGAQVEFSLLPWLALEMDMGGIFDFSIFEDMYLDIPLLVKIGGRPGPMELFVNVGYTIGAGFTIGGTLGFHQGPGVFFWEFLYMKGNSTVLISTAGYKVGLGNKRK
jgi:hypothetical protein